LLDGDTPFVFSTSIATAVGPTALLVNRSVVLVAPVGGVAVLDANAGSAKPRRVLTIVGADVVVELRGVALTGGFSTEWGGGARVEAGMVVVPNVGDALPLSILEAEYAAGDHGALWAAKLRALSARYVAIRRVRGDGNCFYRSLWMGYMERLLTLPVAERRRFWEEEVPSLVSTMRAHLPDDERRHAFVTLGETFARSACALCNVPDSAPDSAAGAADAAVAALLAAARRSDESREVLRWLRLLTSACMRSEKEVSPMLFRRDEVRLNPFHVSSTECRRTDRSDAPAWRSASEQRL
jgi:hypothetical protein